MNKIFITCFMVMLLIGCSTISYKNVKLSDGLDETEARDLAQNYLRISTFKNAYNAYSAKVFEINENANVWFIAFEPKSLLMDQDSRFLVCLTKKDGFVKYSDKWTPTQYQGYNHLVVTREALKEAIYSEDEKLSNRQMDDELKFANPGKAINENFGIEGFSK